MFGDDFFRGGIEDIFNQLARRGNGAEQGQNTTLLSDVIEGKTRYLVFDFSGKKISNVTIKENKEMNQYGELEYGGNKALEIEVTSGEKIKYILDKKFGESKVDYSFINGILEVILKR